jgi:hypothetical protein
MRKLQSKIIVLELIGSKMTSAKNGLKLKPVILESPFAGDINKNIRYARACMRDCLLRGEAPYASHLLYTQLGVLDDNKPDERMLGIEAGLAIGKYMHRSVVYTDLGISKGMEYGIARATKEKRKVEYRELGKDWDENTKPTVEMRTEDVKFLLRLARRVVDYNVMHDSLSVPGGLCCDTEEILATYKRIAKEVGK